MQNDVELQEFCRTLWEKGHRIEAFTNGSFPFPAWRRQVMMTLMMDWKLPGSGEEDTAIETRRMNYNRLTLSDGVKFVVTGQEDLDCAYETYMALDRHLGPRFWVGAAWGRITDQEIVEYITKYGLDWSLNVQVHKHIWDPDKRGV